MSQSYKISFYIILSFIFLLPIFFIPGAVLSLGIAKSSLIVLAAMLGSLAFVYESWREGRMTLPKHALLYVVAALPVVYLLSALLATPSSLSLFGYALEIGTFGYMLLGSVVLALVALVVSTTSRILHVISVLLLSLSLLALFVGAKVILGGDALAMGNFFGNMGNPLGNWTDLAAGFGLLAIFAALTIGMIPMKRSIQALLYALFALSTGLMVVISFPTAFALTLAGSILLFLYFSKVENQFHFSSGHGDTVRKSFFARPTFLPILLGVISLIFLVNPNVSGEKTLGSVVSGYFGINNAEVRPSFSATLDVSKAVLSQAGLLGSGPNTFAHDWLIYKPANINATQFWASAFPFGVGFIPTQIATTGILGSALWLVFLVLLIILSVKAVGQVPEARGERFVLMFTMLGTIFLWAASLFYSPSGTLLLLAFIFAGLFISSLVQMGVISTYTLEPSRSSQARLAYFMVLAVVVVGALSMGWTSAKKTAAAYHFNKAVELSNIEGTPLATVETSLMQAIKADPADIYFVTLSRLNLVRAQAVAQSATGTPEENKAVFEESIRRSIEAARLAVNTNPAGFENWVALGNIYTALVSKPLAVEGAYENASFAYNEAVRRNPSNPELFLLLAQLEINKENTDNARAYIRNAIALKEDYADAYLMLSQLEVKAGNTAAAIASAENLAILVPNNAGLQFELGLLKFSSKNYTGAIESLNKALAISEDYANAKYYLGLALANLNRFAEAQAQFEDLLVTNPGNPELETALSSVKANKIPASPNTASTTTSKQQ